MKPKAPTRKEIKEMKPARTVDAFRRLVEILRSECPWDRKQTPDSIKENLLEEAYEVVDAIDRKEMDSLKSELGDLLLHILFQSLMASENDHFSLEDVIETAMEKLIRRHPHIFDTVQVESDQEVAENWESIKMSEGRLSVMEGIPVQLPSLIRAYRMQEKAANIGFDWPDQQGPLDAVREEVEEWVQSVEHDESAHRQTEELGDLLFSLVNVARKLSLSPEEAMRRSNAKFERRFKYIEQALATQSKEWNETSLEEMDRLWKRAKSDGL